jgi:hypothetical protein
MMGIMQDKISFKYKLPAATLKLPTDYTAAQIAQPTPDYQSHTQDEINCGIYACKKYELDSSVQLLSNFILRDCTESYNMFSDTDLIFKMIFKALVAKILTFINYTVTSNETKYESNLVYHSIMRQTIGAADEVLKMELDNNFIELIIRLPLMLELYKKVFNFDENEKFKYIVLSDITSKYNRLYEIIQHSDMFQSDVYPDEIMNLLLRELRKIYDGSANKDPMHILTDVMKEYNMRITLVSPEYIKEANKAFKNRFKLSYEANYNVDFEQPLKSVDSENRLEFKLAPSQAFMKELGDIQSNLIKKYRKDLPKLTISEYINCIREKRIFVMEYIHKFAPNIEDKKFNYYTITDYVKTIQAEVDTTDTQENKIKVLKRVLNEGNAVNIYNNYITAAFNELVVAPIEHLCVAHKFLNNTLTLVENMYSDVKSVLSISDKKELLSALENHTNLKYQNDVEYIISKWREFVDSAPPRQAANQNVTHIIPYLEIASVDEFAVPLKALFSLIKNNLNNTNPNTSINDNHIPYLIELYQRYSLRSGKIFTQLYEVLQAIQSWTGYSSVDIQEKNVIININSFISDIKETFMDLKKYIHHFRIHVNKEIFEQYVTRNSEGSYYWLEKNFIEKMILDTDVPKNNNLMHFNDRINYILNKYLMKKWRYNARFVKSGTRGGRHYDSTTLAVGVASGSYDIVSIVGVSPNSQTAMNLALSSPGISNCTIKIPEDHRDYKFLQRNYDASLSSTQQHTIPTFPKRRQKAVRGV